MDRSEAKLKFDLRIWQDERYGKYWRVAYREGGEEQIVTLPDWEAVGDFVAERLGLNLMERGYQGAY
jgi:hypothetical protein